MNARMLKIRLRVQYDKAQALRMELGKLRMRGNDDPRIIVMQDLCGIIETSLYESMGTLSWLQFKAQVENGG